MPLLFRYIIIAVILLLAELLYFRVAERFNIIDRPNERSSHSKAVLRGGGIVFLIGAWMWAAFFGVHYPCFLAGLTLVMVVSFIDDVHSMPDWVRLAAQFIAMAMMFYQLDILHPALWLSVILGLIVCVGAMNIFNFMDGINGITAGYSLAILLPLVLFNAREGFVDQNLIIVMILAVLVFAFFNFRPKNKARCFAGDVGSVGIAFILLFLVGRLIVQTGDVTWLVLMAVYGVDGCCTIAHRIMLHENLGQAHRKHAFQLMANELGMSHLSVSLLYLGLQLIISLVMVYLIPSSGFAHWTYLIIVLLLLVGTYCLFMKKYYHLHEEYLSSVEH